MFIRNDILNPEMMVPDIGRNQLTIGNYKNTKIKFNVKNIGLLIKRVIRFNRVMKIPARFNSMIFFRIDQLKNNGGMLLYIINVHTTSVQVMKTSSEDVYLFKNNKLNIVQIMKKKVVI